MRALVLILLVIQAVASDAADRSIGAVKLDLKRSSSGREKLTFTSKDANLLFPALGGADDPSVVGASIELLTPVEGVVALTIPPGLGNPGWRISDRTLDSYTYRNGGSPDGPSVVRSLSLREARGIKLVAREIGLALGTIAGQGSVGIRITTGGSRRCALFEESSVVIDMPGRFLGRGAVSTGGDCSDEALGVPPVDPCDNGTIDAGEQCDSGVFQPGSPSTGIVCLNCQICAVTNQNMCRWFFATYPCCDPAATCVETGPFSGNCVIPTTTTTSTTSSTSTTLFPGCGNGAVGPGEQCDGSGEACGLGDQAGCFPPGGPNECQCCGVTTCYEGGASTPISCCEGRCAYYPPFTAGVSFGLGECATECAPYGTSCQVGLPCCPGLTCGPVPGVPSSFPYSLYCQ